MRMNRQPINLAVLVSGGGTTLQNFVDRIADGSLNARINVVVASRPNVRAIDRAFAAKIPTHVVDRRAYQDAHPFSERVFELIDDASVDLICMGGWLCFTPVPWRYEHRVMNIHPSLLPDFGGKGMWGAKVHQAVIDAGRSESGCTVHFVDDEYDAGPIILQRKCGVRSDDSIDSLSQRVAIEEAIAFPEAIGLFADGKLSLNGRRVVIR